MFKMLILKIFCMNELLLSLRVIICVMSVFVRSISGSKAPKVPTTIKTKVSVVGAVFAVNSAPVMSPPVIACVRPFILMTWQGYPNPLSTGKELLKSIPIPVPAILSYIEFSCENHFQHPFPINRAQIIGFQLWGNYTSYLQ